MRVLLFFLVMMVSLQEGISQKIQLCGHRGVMYPEQAENALSGFRWVAAQVRPDTMMVEIDLRKSKDGTIYLMHDEAVDRTTNGTGKISELSDVYLNSLYLKTSGGVPTTERIPTFKEVLTYAQRNPVKLMLDVKIDIWEEVIQHVRAANLEKRCLVLTFKVEYSKRVAAASSTIGLSCLITSEEEWKAIEALQIPAQQLVAYISAITDSSLIALLKSKKIKVMTDVSEYLRHNAKPLNAEEYAQKVKQQSLDILISDFPVEAWKGVK
ncbi:MAG: glycerophosphodiester phosphodiesterase family protein [Bacteroidetes bacterium]|nr:glycerophosphodiester phosphodiesterase family protein [Bacteroidota bacterium]